MHTRLLLSPPLPAAMNMALDVALMARARATGERVLRVYAWATPTLSLGRNQPARGRYDEARARREGIAIVRRPTGGRAVLHHREVTYSVTAPLEGEPLGETYARINALLIAGLRRLGVKAELAAPAAHAPAPSLAPCFEEPTAGELVAGGRKLVGSAQWRDEAALLQHGSILVEDDQPLLLGLLRERVPPSPAPATLRHLLGRVPSVAEVAEALFAAAREHGSVERWEVDAPLLADAESQCREFEDPSWTWRR